MSNFHYKLQEAIYGPNVSFADHDLGFDEGRMSAWIIFADGNRRDGVGDLLEIDGIDTSRHRRNPVVLSDHAKLVTLPVALAEDPQTKQYTVVLDPVAKQGRANCFFYQGKKSLPPETFQSDDPFDMEVMKTKEYDHALYCEQLYDLLVKRFIRGGSIGYQVQRGYQIPADYQKGIPQGTHLQNVLMLECSIVTMPCNADTVVKVLSMPKVCGKPLSPMLVKSLSPYAPPKKAMMGYEGTKGTFEQDKYQRARDARLKVTDHIRHGTEDQRQRARQQADVRSEQLDQATQRLTPADRQQLGGRQDFKSIRLKYRKKAAEDAPKQPRFILEPRYSQTSEGKPRFGVVDPVWDVIDTHKKPGRWGKLDNIHWTAENQFLENLTGEVAQAHVDRLNAEYEASQKSVQVAIPHGEQIQHTDIPPSQWYPGVGTVNSKANGSQDDPEIITPTEQQLNHPNWEIITGEDETGYYLDYTTTSVDGPYLNRNVTLPRSPGTTAMYEGRPRARVYFPSAVEAEHAANRLRQTTHRAPKEKSIPSQQDGSRKNIKIIHPDLTNETQEFDTREEAEGVAQAMRAEHPRRSFQVQVRPSTANPGRFEVISGERIVQDMSPQNRSNLSRYGSPRPGLQDFGGDLTGVIEDRGDQRVDHDPERIADRLGIPRKGSKDFKSIRLKYRRKSAEDQAKLENQQAMYDLVQEEDDEEAIAASQAARAALRRQNRHMLIGNAIGNVIGGAAGALLSGDPVLGCASGACLGGSAGMAAGYPTGRRKDMEGSDVRARIKSIRLKYRSKSLTIPHAKASYFQNCPRDETGHCLPKGSADRHRPKDDEGKGKQRPSRPEPEKIRTRPHPRDLNPPDILTLLEQLFNDPRTRGLPPEQFIALLKRAMLEAVGGDPQVLQANPPTPEEILVILRMLLGRFSDQALNEISVWFLMDGSNQTIIDVFGSGSIEIGKRLVSAIAGLVGKEAAHFTNQGVQPQGQGWVLVEPLRPEMVQEQPEEQPEEMVEGGKSLPVQVKGELEREKYAEAYKHKVKTPIDLDDDEADEALNAALEQLTADEVMRFSDTDDTNYEAHHDRVVRQDRGIEKSLPVQVKGKRELDRANAALQQWAAEPNYDNTNEHLRASAALNQNDRVTYHRGIAPASPEPEGLVDDPPIPNDKGLSRQVKGDHEIGKYRDALNASLKNPSPTTLAGWASAVNQLVSDEEDSAVVANARDHGEHDLHPDSIADARRRLGDQGSKAVPGKRQLLDYPYRAAFDPETRGYHVRHQGTGDVVHSYGPTPDWVEGRIPDSRDRRIWENQAAQHASRLNSEIRKRGEGLLRKVNLSHPEIAADRYLDQGDEESANFLRGEYADFHQQQHRQQQNNKAIQPTDEEIIEEARKQTQEGNPAPNQPKSFAGSWISKAIYSFRTKANPKPNFRHGIAMEIAPTGKGSEHSVFKVGFAVNPDLPEDHPEASVPVSEEHLGIFGNEQEARQAASLAAREHSQKNPSHVVFIPPPHELSEAEEPVRREVHLGGTDLADPKVATQREHRRDRVAAHERDIIPAQRRREAARNTRLLHKPDTAAGATDKKQFQAAKAINVTAYAPSPGNRQAEAEEEERKQESGARRFREDAVQVLTGRSPLSHYEEEMRSQPLVPKPYSGKGISSIRQKYRGTGGRAWRVKNNAPGVSMIYVDEKDLERLQRMAKSRGVELDNLGAAGSLIKMRARGIDREVDFLAKMCGKEPEGGWNKRGRKPQMGDLIETKAKPSERVVAPSPVKTAQMPDQDEKAYKELPELLDSAEKGLDELKAKLANW